MATLTIPDLDIDDLHKCVYDQTYEDIYQDLKTFFDTKPIIMVPENQSHESIIAMDKLRLSYTRLIALKALLDYQESKEQ